MIKIVEVEGRNCNLKKTLTRKRVAARRKLLNKSAMLKTTKKRNSHNLSL